jgi:DNA topoisomerase I
VLAAVALAGEVPKSKTAHKRRINDAVKGVAFFLGNTPAVTRASYIDPRVFDRFDSGWTIALPKRTGDELLANETTRRRVEKAVLDLISEPRGSDLVERPLAA